MNSRKIRTTTGATMGVVIACCIILVLVIVGLFQITMIFGGSQELRNAVDAGTLNVGKEAVMLKTTPGGGAEGEFRDVCDTKGQIGLMNINRVLGKSFLYNANAHAMDSEGMGSGDASQHANQAADAAQAICDRITSQLKDVNKTQPYFNQFIKVNSIKMFGHAVVKAENGEWDTAFVDRDDESNLRIDKDQLPSSYTLPADATKSIKEKGKGGDTLFFKGYHPINVNSKQLHFVPFKYDEKPHLINGFYFAASKVGVPGWGKPVPNALSAKGATDKISFNNTAVAYVVANPQRQYQAAIPQGYVHIRLEKNEAQWKYQGLVTEKTTTYGYYPGQIQFHVRDAGSGTMNIKATLGMQYALPTLDAAINPLYGTGDNTKIMNAILQRVRQIKHDFTMSDLHNVLKTVPTIGIDEGDFYIFPTYSSADKTDPEIKAAHSSIAKGMAPWIGNAADGSEKDDYDTDGKSFIPFVPTPNVVIMTMTGIGCKPGVFGASESGSLDWRPGTGYGGCLGKLTIKRTTKIYYSGLCTIL